MQNQSRGRGGGRVGGRSRGNRQPRRGDHQSSTPSSCTTTPSTSFTPRPPRTNYRPQKPRQETHSVPAHASLYPGKAVSIILKQDQPTGHEVRGIVTDLLTRGDHPRGVKVRLRDGRVGRVQRLVSDDEGVRGEAAVRGEGAGLQRNGEVGGAGGGRGGTFKHVKDIRDEDEYFWDEGRVQESSSVGGGGLFAALEEADKKHQVARVRGRESSIGKNEVGGGEVVSCPVCRVFEGDEVAVAHHVEEHFGG